MKIHQEALHAFRKLLFAYTKNDTQYHIYEDLGSQLRWVQVNDLLFHPGTAALFHKYNEKYVIKVEVHEQKDRRLHNIANAGANTGKVPKKDSNGGRTAGRTKLVRNRGEKVDYTSAPATPEKGYGKIPSMELRLMRRVYERVSTTLIAYTSISRRCR